MGRAQGIENLFEAVEILKNEKDVHFLFIGSGAKRSWMDIEICNKELHNVTILDQRPRSDQGNFLNACDIALVSLLPGMTGAGVPSRLYNIMSAGKPIIAVTGYGSEIEFVVREEGIGWFVPAGRPEMLANAMLESCSKPELLLQMGERARSAAVDVFSKEPYDGPLCELENIILTPHLGSYAAEGKLQMEIDAVSNLIQVLNTNVS